jgi:hypothetical protein
MAMQDTILFTGKELNFEIPKMTELNSAEQRLRDKLTKNEDLQTKYQDEIRKNINIDTQALVSDFSRTQQYEAVKAFQDKWTKIAKEKGNKLTSDDLMEMEKDKSGIANLQNEWQSSQKLWEQDSAMIKKSPGDFDVPKFTADTDAFLSSGQYKPNSLEYSGINMEDFFSGENWRGSASSTEDAIAGRDGFDTYTLKSSNATPEEAKRHILQVVLSDTTGRALKGIIKDFMNEPETEGLTPKIKYLKAFDTDNSGTISGTEMAAANVKMSSRNILTNPILAYAQDKYLPNVIKEKVTTDKRRRPNPVLGGSTVSQNFTDENGVKTSINTKNVPPDKVPVPPGTVVDPNAASEPVNETVPWEGSAYLVPRKSANSTIYAFNTKETEIPIAVKGKDRADGIVKGKVKDFFKNNATISVASYNSADHSVKLRGAGADTSDLSYDQIKSLPEGIRNNILGLKIQTEAGLVTLEEILSGAKTDAAAGAGEQNNTKPKLY